MTTVPVSLGFLRPHSARITASEPHITYGHDRPVVDGHAWEWDYHAPVRIEWSLTVDLTGTLADCGLNDTARINAVLSWHSTWTNLRGSSQITTVVDGHNALGMQIPGDVLGGTLNLAATVTLGQPGSDADRLAPRRPGSPLWTTRSSVILEGAAARMPVMAVDFDNTGRGRPSGLWLLECDNDLTASVTGAILLYVNTGHPDIQELLEHPGRPTATSTERFISCDVARQLILRALQHDELDEHHTYDEGTVGDLYLTLLRTHLPGRPLNQLRRQFEDDPGEVEAELLARTWDRRT